MTIPNLIQLFGGLAALLSGIDLLSAGMEELAGKRIRESIPFSPQAQDELLEFHTLVSEAWDLALKALESGDKVVARAVAADEDQIDIMEKRLRESHKERQAHGIYAPKADVLFIETPRNLERIGDHADNLAVSVLRE